MYGMINAIIKNMVDQGSVKKGESMATVISTKKDYVIELERKDISNFNMIAYTNSGCYYICILRFKDKMGQLLLELHLNELQVLRMIDNINEYFSAGWQLFDLCLLSDIMSLQPGVTDSINIFHNYDTFIESESDYMHILEVKEYNKYTESMVNRLRIEMSQEDMEALCNVLYFIFLIDIDETVEFTDAFRSANLQNIDSYMLTDFYNEQHRE